MNISARNKLQGKIERVQEGAVQALVTLKTSGGDQVSATISLEAVKQLGLAAGMDATAIVKATDLMIGIGDMKLSARNQLDGEVVAVQEGAVSAVVKVKTAGGNTLSATISMDAVKELGLTAGLKVKAVVKATSVMIAI